MDEVKARYSFQVKTALGMSFNILDKNQNTIATINSTGANRNSAELVDGKGNVICELRREGGLFSQKFSITKDNKEIGELKYSMLGSKMLIRDIRQNITGRTSKYGRTYKAIDVFINGTKVATYNSEMTEVDILDTKLDKTLLWFMAYQISAERRARIAGGGI